MREYNRLPNGEVETVIPIRLKYDGHKTVLTLPEDAPPELRAEAMNPMQKALVPGLRFRDKPEAGEASSISDLAQRGDGAHLPIPQPGACQPRVRHHPRHRGRRRPRRLHAQTPPPRHPRRLGRTAKGIWLPVTNQVPQSQIFGRC